MTQPIGRSRLYRKEWVVVHFVTADDDGDCCPSLVRQLDAHYTATYAGQVDKADVRLICEGEGINAVGQLQLRLWNLKGEFKHAYLGHRYAQEMGWAPEEYRLVIAGSAADKALATGTGA